jgi:hypothetical protein
MVNTSDNKITVFPTSSFVVSVTLDENTVTTTMKGGKEYTVELEPRIIAILVKTINEGGSMGTFFNEYTRPALDKAKALSV